MAVFEASKGFHFSEDGIEPWAHFERVEGSGLGTEPVKFRFETGDSKVIERLLGIDGVTRVDSPPASRAKAQPQE
jgi:hypothetical protein